MFASIWSVLSSSLLFWEIAGYVCTFIVIAGCVGEYIAEFTHIPKADDKRHRISKLSLIILTMGIAGELLTAVRSSQISGQVIAELQTSVKNAKKSASDAADAAAQAKTSADGAKTKADAVGVEADQANGAADTARLVASNAKDLAGEVSKKAEDINAELTMAQRTLGARHVLDESVISSDLEKGFKGERISFKSYFQDWEALLLCRQLVDAASKPAVGVVVDNECGSEPLPPPPHFPTEELLITAPTIEQAQRLSMAIAKQGVVILFANLGVTPEMTVMVGHLPSQPLFWPTQPKGSIKAPSKRKAKP